MNRCNSTRWSALGIRTFGLRQSGACWLSLGLVVCLLTGCKSDKKDANAKENGPEKSVSDPNFEQAILEALQADLKKISVLPLVGIEDCRPSPRPIETRMSESTDSETHGQKLYELYAKFAKEYENLTWASANSESVTPARIGQVIVKDSFHAEELSAVALDSVPVNEKHFAKGKRYSYFLMAKYAPDTAGTDQGWIYATVLPDKKTITGIGKIESCMNCHEKAPYDRLFGPK